MRPLIFSALLVVTALPAAAHAKTAKCHDVSGKFVKCSAPGAIPVAAVAAAPAPVAAASMANAKATGCKDAKGHFAKCAAPTATAMAPAPTAAPNIPQTPARPAMTTAAAAPAMAAGSAPAGATAKCKDGTFSMSKHHSGSCSRHGGVATFL